MTEYDAQTIATAEMDPGERLLWAGCQNPSRALLPSIPLVLFGIPWTGFSLFWIFMASGGFGQSSGGPGIIFSLFGLPFVLIGLLLLSSPYWIYRAAARTVCAISDRRLLIIRAGSTRKIQSYTARDISNLERREQPDGSGDLIFARRYYTSTDSDGFRSNNTQNIGFFGIPDVRNVERIIRENLMRETALSPNNL